MTGDKHAEAVDRATRVFNAASANWDDSPFWDRLGAETVRRLDLGPGMHVADLCAGSGASALPAAQAVGPTGRVVAVDVAGDMLARVEAKAAAAGLTNLRTVCADATASGLPEASYDAVVCVFGVFFVPDMIGFVREMWRLVRPGGRLAVTNWGEVVFTPVGPLFWAAVAEVAPELQPPTGAPVPWAAIDSPDKMAALFTAAGAERPVVAEVRSDEPLSAPEDAWTAVLGSGFRGTVDALGPDRQGEVRRRLVAAVSRDHVEQVRSDVLYAVATKPGAPTSG